MQSILHKREIIEASNGLFIDFDLSWLHEGKIRLFGLSKDNVACQFSRYQSKILGNRLDCAAYIFHKYKFDDVIFVIYVCK